MSAAVVLAAALEGYRFCYVSGDDDKQGVGAVVTGTERLRLPENPWTDPRRTGPAAIGGPGLLRPVGGGGRLCRKAASTLLESMSKLARSSRCLQGARRATRLSGTILSTSPRGGLGKGAAVRSWSNWPRSAIVRSWNNSRRSASRWSANWPQ